MNNKNWKLIVMAVFTFSFLSFNLALAQANQCPANAPGCTNLVVEIPGVGKQVTDPVQYILGVYKFGLAAGGLIAMLIIVFAAIERIVSAGNPSKIDDANDRIKNAIWGLALLLGAFLILSTINPELVKLQKPNLPQVQTTGGGLEGLADVVAQQAINLAHEKIEPAVDVFDKASANRTDIIAQIKNESGYLVGGDSPDVRTYPNFDKLSIEDKRRLSDANAQYFDTSRDVHKTYLDLAQTTWDQYSKGLSRTTPTPSGYTFGYSGVQLASEYDRVQSAAANGCVGVTIDNNLTACRALINLKKHQDTYQQAVSNANTADAASKEFE